MTEETRDTVQKVAEYVNVEKVLLLKRVKIISIVGLISLIIGLIMLSVEPASTLPVYDCLEGFCLGLSVGAMITMVLYTTGLLAKIKRRKAKVTKVFAVVAVIIAAFVIIASIVASIY